MKKLAFVFVLFSGSFNSLVNSAAASDIYPTTMGALSQRATSITLIAMGTPFSSRKCQGYELAYSRIGHVAAVSGCRNDQKVDREVQLDPAQVQQMVELLSIFRLAPLTSEDYSKPCPSFDGGGWRGSAIVPREGMQNFLMSMIVCKSRTPNAKLYVDPNQRDRTQEVEEFLNSLL